MIPGESVPIFPSFFASPCVIIEGLFYLHGIPEREA
jgi:hypothetical protein